MANVANGDLLQLSLVGRAFGQRVMFTRSFRVSAAPSTPTTINDFCNDVLNSMLPGGSNVILVDAYMECMSSSYALQFMRAQIIKPVRYRAVETLNPQNGLKGVAGTANLAAVIAFNTARSGRDQVANVHIGPIGASSTVAGALDGALLGELADVRDEYSQQRAVGPGQGQITPIIFHSKTPGPTLFWDDIIGGTIMTATRVMRRRTLGVGE